MANAIWLQSLTVSSWTSFSRAPVGKYQISCLCYLTSTPQIKPLQASVHLIPILPCVTPSSTLSSPLMPSLSAISSVFSGILVLWLTSVRPVHYPAGSPHFLFHGDWGTPEYTCAMATIPHTLKARKSLVFLFPVAAAKPWLLHSPWDILSFKCLLCPPPACSPTLHGLSHSSTNFKHFVLVSPPLLPMEVFLLPLDWETMLWHGDYDTQVVVSLAG
jgi:hypothetical protein